MHNLAETKRELLALSAEPSLAERSATLAELAAALDSEEAHHWARVDLFALFPLDAVADPKRPAIINRASKVEMFRNVLILFPLLITWLGIALATSRYGELLRESPEAGRQPFIQLWEDGFGGSSIRFSTIGYLDVAAIMAVIALSVWLGQLRRQLDVKIARGEDAVWGRLQMCLVAATVALARVSFDSPLRFNEALTQSAEGMKAASNQIRASSASVTSLMNSASETVTQYEQGHAEVNRAITALAQNTEAISNAVGALSTGFRSLESKLDDSIDQTRALVTGNEELADKLADALDTSATSGAQLSRATRDASTIVAQLQAERAAQGSVSDALNATSRELASGAASLSSVLSEAERASSVAGTAGAELRHATTDFAGALAEIHQVAQTVQSALGGTAESLPGRLQMVGEGLDRLSTRATSESEASRHALTQLAATITAELHGATASLNEAALALTRAAQGGSPDEPRRRIFSGRS